MDDQQDRTTCKRCRGKGVIANFSHHDKGICFDCKGSGTVPAAKPPKARKVKAKPVFGPEPKPMSDEEWIAHIYGVS